MRDLTFIYSSSLIIGRYYDLTTKVVTDQLRVLLAGVIDQTKQSAIWDEWIEAWCQFPLDGFLRSTKEAIEQILPREFRIGLDKLDKFLPWPEAAITAYSTFTYTEQLDQSLVQYLRDQLGGWWSPHMHHIDGGMYKLPNKFARCLKDEIKYNFTVTEIEYHSPPGEDEHIKVVVRGFKREGESRISKCSVEGNAVIVTTPVHILRQIKFNAIHSTPQLPFQFYKAIEDIWYGPSTKIMIPCKTRFWEKDPNPIQGGFSKTDLPIGQIHYPSNPGFNSIPGEIKGGILLCYTWKSEALMFGSLEKHIAIAEAVEQIAEIHPEINEEKDTAKAEIEAWYNEPAAQGAYALLKPQQFHNVRWLMYPWKNVYFAGEAISFASGWIQGALESGLRAAYQFYARNENAAPEQAN